jgi:hypothetical protein
MKIRYKLSSDMDLKKLRIWCAENCIGYYKISNPANGFSKTQYTRAGYSNGVLVLTSGNATFDTKIDAMAFKLRWL